MPHSYTGALIATQMNFFKSLLKRRKKPKKLALAKGGPIFLGVLHLFGHFAFFGEKNIPVTNVIYIYNKNLRRFNCERYT